MSEFDEVDLSLPKIPSRGTNFGCDNESTGSFDRMNDVHGIFRRDQFTVQFPTDVDAGTIRD